MLIAQCNIEGKKTDVTVLFTFTCHKCRRPVTLYRTKGKCSHCHHLYDLSESVKITSTTGVLGDKRMSNDELEKIVDKKVEDIEKNQVVGVYDSEEDLAKAEEYNEGYAEGYRAGYTDGTKENGVVWHVLEEDPNDLPVGEVFYYFDQNPNLKDRKVYGRSIGYYDHFNKAWKGYYQGCPCKITNVIAWSEIPSWRGLPT